MTKDPALYQHIQQHDHALIAAEPASRGSAAQPPSLLHCRETQTVERWETSSSFIICSDEWKRARQPRWNWKKRGKRADEAYL